MRRNLGDRKCAIRGQSPIFWLSRYFTVLYLIVPLLPAHSTTHHTVLYRSLALAVAFMRDSATCVHHGTATQAVGGCQWC